MLIDKIHRRLGDIIINEIDGMDESSLQKLIVQGEESIAVATKERDDNVKYQSAKQAVSDLSAGLKEVKSYQTAKIQYALIRLRDMGKV